MNFKDFCVDLLFPPRCLLCGSVTEAIHAICPACQEKKLIDQNFVCKKCGKPQHSCICLSMPYSFTAVISAIPYDLDAVKAIKVLKFDTKSSVSLCFARMMYSAYINSRISFTPSTISYVPMNKAKEALRGKNQAKELCEHLARKLSLPIIPPPAIHTDNTVAQHSLKAHERWENAKNIYIPTNERVRGSIILVDDIMTTGATLEIMTRIFLQSGAENVLCLTAATTLKD